VGKIYSFAERLAQTHNIKFFKGKSNPDSEFFKVFFFNEACESAPVKEGVRKEAFNRPSVQGERRPDSEYLIMHVFPKTNRVQIEDCNLHKALKARVVDDFETESEGSIMSVETQMETLVAQWLKLFRDGM